MDRKKFIKTVSITGAGLLITKDLFAKPRGPIYGHNGMKYRLDTKWCKADTQKFPVNDCHEMVQDSKGRIHMITNETKNNVMVFNESGKLLKTWGNQFPGGHGLSLANENGQEFLFITDVLKNQVYKTTLDGRMLLTLDIPLETGKYNKAEQFKPTEVAIAENGDFYVADGYGEQYILHYDNQGRLKNFFGGRGDKNKNLDNAHGICVDHRNSIPTLLVTDRKINCFKRFTMEGELIEVIKLPGACVCRPVIKGEYLYAAVLRSPNISAVGTGFVTILDKNNRVVSNIGGTEPSYLNGVLQSMVQAEKIFIHPHDVCVDNDENLYVAQWNSGKIYPFKLNRV